MTTQPETPTAPKGPGGSKEAQAMCQYIFTWETMFAKRAAAAGKAEIAQMSKDVALAMALEGYVLQTTGEEMQGLLTQYDAR
jgi:hypothetical protein